MLSRLGYPALRWLHRHVHAFQTYLDDWLALLEDSPYRSEIQ
jgi:hypothetical protein